MRGLLIALMAGVLCADEGEALYQRHCAGCHARFHPVDQLMKNFMHENNQLLKLKGPTVNQLAFRLKQRIGDADADREFHLMEVTEFVIDYVRKPDKQKTVCMQEVIRHFDTMPAMSKQQIDEDALRVVAEWIYWSDIPEEKVAYEVDQ